MEVANIFLQLIDLKLHFLLAFPDLMQLKVGDQFSGWYEAPMSLGKTEFLLEVEKVVEEEEVEEVEVIIQFDTFNHKIITIKTRG